MIDFTIKTEDLKKGLTLTSLSVAPTKDIEESHCLFNVIDNVLEITSTDKNTKLSKAVLEIANANGVLGLFTADPSTLLNLVRKSETDTIRFVYHSDRKTVEIHSSENAESYISLPSFDVSTPMPGVFENAYEIKVVDAGIFLKGVRFAQGFVNPKDSKYDNIYISKGVIYGSNGSNQVGAFASTEFDGMDDLAIPGTAVPDIVNLITKLDLLEVSIRTTSNIVVLCSEDSRFNFGFTKVQANMPKMPIDIAEPDQNGWMLDKAAFLKKLGRLRLSGGEKLGVRANLSAAEFGMATVSERSSKETMACNRIKGADDKTFIFDCRLIENAVDLLGSTVGSSIKEIKMYFDKRITFYSSGNFEIEEKDGPVTKPFTCVALMAQARE